MSWYNPGSFNPFEGLMNGSGGSTTAIDNLTGVWHNITNQGDPGIKGDFMDPAGNINTYIKPDQVGDNGAGEASLAEYMAEHPGASYEEILQYMSTQSDEWAEKYLDYLTERGELDRANEYTASREDTAYQRLVEDLKKAGLNPYWLMSSGSASTTTTGSQGYVKMSEGANSRSISNYSKLKELLLSYLKYQFDTVYKGSSLAIDFFDSILDFAGKAIGAGKKKF